MRIDKKVCVLGLGYIGLPTAALLANRGCNVIGVDIDSRSIDLINQGKVHIVEPDLETFVQSAVSSGRLYAQLEPEAADVFVICVPTPFYEDKVIPEPNLEYVLAAAKSISQYLQPGNLVLLESTSPVGTTEKLREVLAESVDHIDEVAMAYCPERVLPGRIILELVENDRIVGGISPQDAKKAKEFYKLFVNGQVLTTNCRTAEMIKLVENSFRDTNIAFANELSILCDSLQVNVNEVIQLANHHPRVNILSPGCGVGGHCIAVDPWFLVAANPDHARLIRMARQVNDYKSTWVISKIEGAAHDFQAKQGRPATIAALGASFKPNVDDLRESPALKIIKNLNKKGCDLLVVEPHVDKIEGISLSSLEEAMQSSDIIAILVAHRQFQQIKASNKILLDFCGAIR